MIDKLILYVMFSSIKINDMGTHGIHRNDLIASTAAEEFDSSNKLLVSD